MSLLELVQSQPVVDDEEGPSDVGKEFARFIRANGEALSSIFTEQVLARNDKLERENKELWNIVWKEYGPGELRRAIVRYNQRGTGYRCTCYYCCINASPLVHPPNYTRRCEIGFFVKTAIARSGLSFSNARQLAVGETRVEPVHRPGIGIFQSEAFHIIFVNLDNVYNFAYGLRVADAMTNTDKIVFAKFQSLFRMIREGQHHTFPPSH